MRKGKIRWSMRGLRNISMDEEREREREGKERERKSEGERII